MNNKISFGLLFFEVWIHPRQILRKILEENPRFFVRPLVFYFGLFPALVPNYYFPFLHKPIFLILPIGIIGCLISAVSGFYLFSGLGYWIGKQLGGTGSFDSLKTATAWAYPPCIVGYFFSLLSELPRW